MIDLLFTLAFWPWVLTVALFGALIFATWRDAFAFGFLALAIYFAVAFFAFGTNPIVWIGDHPGAALVASGAYLAAGALWSLFKWDRRMASPYIQDAIKDARKKYDEMVNFSGERDFYSSVYFPNRAQPSSNKERITTWIALWPFSLAGYFIGEILLRFFERIYDVLSGLYVSITKRHIPD